MTLAPWRSPPTRWRSSVRDGCVVRQRPGAKNALGLVKFVFPNDSNVYLHGTPAPQLFSRPRRDFSHGCVRVEDPVALAEWVLRGQDDWSRDQVLVAMNANQSRRVNLARPIQVILFYITAVVMPEDGSLRFAEDVYGHDTRLNNALVSSRDPMNAVSTSRLVREKEPQARSHSVRR